MQKSKHHLCVFLYISPFTFALNRQYYDCPANSKKQHWYYQVCHWNAGKNSLLTFLVDTEQPEPHFGAVFLWRKSDTCFLAVVWTPQSYEKSMLDSWVSSQLTDSFELLLTLCGNSPNGQRVLEKAIGKSSWQDRSKDNFLITLVVTHVKVFQ